MATQQISAHISTTVKKALDDLSRQRGLKKSHIIEQALIHHLQALQALPGFAVVPTKLVVGEEDFDELVEDRPPRDIAAIRGLRDGD